MSINQQIIKNSIFLLSSNVLAKIINFILLIVLTRALGVEGFGLFSFGLAYTSLFTIFVNMGISNFLIQNLARNKEQGGEFISLTLPGIIVFSIITFIMINGSIVVTNWSPEECRIIFLFSIYTILDAISRYFISIFRAYQRMEYEALINFTERSGLLLFALILWCYQVKLTMFISAFNLVLLLKVFFSFYLVLKYFIKIQPRWFSKKIFSILKQSYPFALMSIFGIISTRIDTVMLKIFYNNEMVGLYNTAHKIIDSISFIPENIAFAFFPALAYLYFNQNKDFELTFERFFRYLFILAVPVFIYLYSFAPQIISFLFDPDFYQSYLALKWLSVWLFVIFIKYVFATALTAIGKQHVFSLYMGITVLVNIILNYLLIPRYQIAGACMATIVSELVTTVMAFIFIRKHVVLFKNLYKYAAMMAAGIILIYFNQLIRHWNVLFIFFISFSLYLGCLISLKLTSYREFLNGYSLLKEKLLVRKP